MKMRSALEVPVSGNAIRHREYKPGSGVHQPQTCHNRFLYEQL